MNQEDKILFSIIIPTYNRAHLISKAIQSVIDQTYNHWELIIVDDGSTDNTEEVVHKFNDQRIRYFQKDHEERSVARNFGIEKSRGLYISFLDDDDYLLSDYLEMFSKMIYQKQIPVAVFICNAYIELKGIIKEIQKIPKGITIDPVLAIWKDQPGITQMMIHKSILQHEKFDFRFPFGQDFHLWIRIALKYSFFEIKSTLCVFIHHTDNGTIKKFVSDINKNAWLSIAFIDDLIDRFRNEFKIHYFKYIADWRNHHIYGFASAALKKGDFLLFRQLYKELSFIGSKRITIYRIFSLTLRFPFYWMKFLIKKIKLNKSITLLISIFCFMNF